MIITTSDFSPGARREAIRDDAAPVGLTNGEQLLNLLFEHEMGVRKTSLDLFDLALLESEMDRRSADGSPS